MALRFGSLMAILHERVGRKVMGIATWLDGARGVMAIERRVRPDGIANGHRGSPALSRARWPFIKLQRELSRDGHASGEDTLDRLAVDCFAFTTRCVAHRAVCDAVDVAQRTGRVLVH
jgi:hypothetical protein